MMPSSAHVEHARDVGRLVHRPDDHLQAEVFRCLTTRWRRGRGNSATRSCAPAACTFRGSASTRLPCQVDRGDLRRLALHHLQRAEVERLDGAPRALALRISAISSRANSSGATVSSGAFGGELGFDVEACAFRRRTSASRGMRVPSTGCCCGKRLRVLRAGPQAADVVALQLGEGERADGRPGRGDPLAVGAARDVGIEAAVVVHHHHAVLASRRSRARACRRRARARAGRRAGCSRAAGPRAPRWPWTSIACEWAHEEAGRARLPRRLTESSASGW